MIWSSKLTRNEKGQRQATSSQWPEASRQNYIILRIPLTA